MLKPKPYEVVTLILAVVCISFTKPAETVTTRFHTPAGYQQITTSPGSFGAWLQQLSLKPAGTHTLTYRGTIANTDKYTAAVIDMSVGNQDLQQCADAVMRLRGEYLFQKKAYDKISFKFTSGFNCDFVHFADGYRYQQSGKWRLAAKKDYSYANFLRYMNLVFSYAGTLSLDKELKKVESENDLKTGDIFIKGGSPGHCFIIMDVAKNKAGKKCFLLAQSFMPAQNIQILQSGGPWFRLDEPANIPYGNLVQLMYLKRFE
ncbi:DUF4846 domain-containing protein [Mucilaginibacter jinjuensis]|uniref:DUF4846 domain-containing protein n=1 Tax=Mucilaginibacter jinjuensis TaxID=1176721 RepID=A0ABY7T8T7_9SPHI|nr:DUF4846 domain-containing protein [Mucilaginibacter jinjuensis]WCT12900.1 DUF4846 domain-containing protein [Mucilaginibacter jinjuensis]